MHESPPAAYHRIVHALAIVLTVAVFPLIWVGSLVTTYDAGMAVPDWPATYEHNMFLYPIQKWVFGSFDVLAEHSHRLLGALAGFLSIGLVVAAWRYEDRPWFRWWTVGVLVAVIAQGVLGGMRVRLDARTLALVHGCSASLFFAIATATAVMSSRFWIQGELTRETRPSTAGLALCLTVMSFLQLILGANLRHITGETDHRVFFGFVHGHLTLAVAVALLVILLAASADYFRAPAPVRMPARLLVILVVVQICLGIGTWIVNYALPWSELTEKLARYTIQAKGYWESMIVTAHVAVGSLIVSLSTVTALRAWRTRARTQAANEVQWQWKKRFA